MSGPLTGGPKSPYDDKGNKSSSRKARYDSVSVGGGGVGASCGPQVPSGFNHHMFIQD